MEAVGTGTAPCVCVCVRVCVCVCTLRWEIIVRVRVALAAVLHQEVGVVPGHADDAVRLVQQDVGQHAPVAVHHDHLAVRSTKQHLQGEGGGAGTGELDLSGGQVETKEDYSKRSLLYRGRNHPTHSVYE